MNLYQDHILDHYHNPRHTTPLTTSTHTSDGHNASCGDTLFTALHIKDDVIVDVSFRGDGCAISQAAASILMEYLKGKDVEILKNMTASAMIRLLEIPVYPARIKCGLLALKTAQQALKNKE